MLPVRRRFSTTCAFLLLAAAVSACSPGGLFSGDMMWAPHRPQQTDSATLQSALLALSEGDRAGEIVLTEAELSSLLGALLVDKSGADGIIRDVQVWMEPDTIYVQLLLRRGVIPIIPTDVALNFEGSLRTEDGRLQFGLARAGIGVIPLLSQPVLTLAQEQLNLAIDQLINRASPLEIELDTETMTIRLP